MSACPSSWVGARRSSGRSPASSWVGRPAGGARSFLPSGSWYLTPLAGVGGTSGSMKSQASSRVARSACYPVSMSLNETAHTPSLSQRDPAVLLQCVNALPWRRTQSTAPFNGALHSWSLDPWPPKPQQSLCVCGTWDLALPGARRVTLKTAHCNSTWWAKLKSSPRSSLGSSFTGSRRSTTPQRLWLGAPQAATVHGPRDSI